MLLAANSFADGDISNTFQYSLPNTEADIDHYKQSSDISVVINLWSILLDISLLYHGACSASLD